jgi:hypothetical protein
MPLNPTNSTTLDHHPHARPRFNVVIVYEDFVTGTRAMTVYDSLARSLANHYELANSAWKFEILRQASLKKIAVFDAMEADLVLISVHAGSELPEEVRAWIHLWLAQGNQANCALGLLLAETDEMIGRVAPAHSYLQEVANQHKLDFFSQAGDVPGLPLAPRLAAERDGDRIPRVTSAIGHVLNQTQCATRGEMRD